MPEFIDLGKARKDDVIVTTSGMIGTVWSVDDVGVEMCPGAGDAVGEVGIRVWGEGISPTDQVLLIHRPVQ